MDQKICYRCGSRADFRLVNIMGPGSKLPRSLPMCCDCFADFCVRVSDNVGKHEKAIKTDEEGQLFSLRTEGPYGEGR